jgi:hypothetical protein
VREIERNVNPRVQAKGAAGGGRQGESRVGGAGRRCVCDAYSFLLFNWAIERRNEVFRSCTNNHTIVTTERSTETKSAKDRPFTPLLACCLLSICLLINLDLDLDLAFKPRSTPKPDQGARGMSCQGEGEEARQGGGGRITKFQLPGTRDTCVVLRLTHHRPTGFE